jgi:predicted aspartyl protease
MLTRSVAARSAAYVRTTADRLIPPRAWPQTACFVAGLFLLMVWATPAAAQIPAPIPFTLTRNFAITIHGEIAGAKHVNVLFDTGAVPSVISKSLAARIGVSGQSGPFSTVNNKAEAAYAQVSDVRLGSLQVATLAVVILDLAGLEAALGIPIDAIIGLDFFGNRPLSIDYHRRILEFSSSQPYANLSEAEMVERNGSVFWVVTARLAGNDFRMLVDTGADEVSLFRSSIPAELRATAKNDKLKTSVSMGDTTFRPQTVRIVDSPLASVGLFDGLVSPAALHIVRLELNSHNKCIRWQQD